MSQIASEEMKMWLVNCHSSKHSRQHVTCCWVTVIHCWLSGRVQGWAIVTVSAEHCWTAVWGVRRKADKTWHCVVVTSIAKLESMD